jgi:hypothetical protein
MRDASKNHHFSGRVSGKSWRPCEPVTGLACSIHSGDQPGPAVELGLVIY